MLLLALLSACTSKSAPSPANENTDANTKTKPACTFHEKSAEAGLAFTHTDGSTGRYFILETLASGVALFDYDMDGDLDVYFLNGRPLPLVAGKAPGNRMFRNEGNLKFKDVTDETRTPGSGFSIGCCAADYDGDGDLDLYITCYGSNILYRNDDGIFKDVTAAAGVDDPRFSAGACFFDLENDGDLDLYVSNYSEVDFSDASVCQHGGIDGYCAPGKHRPQSDSLFRNRGDGTFENISTPSNVAKEAKWGMGVVAFDYDDDGRTDIFVANDVSDNYLFHNLGDGTFENVALAKGVALSGNGDEQGSMGIDIADYNRDGRLDIIVTNFQAQLNALYSNEGELGFSDRAMADGLGSTCLQNVSWGTAFIDFDNDSWLDLFIANGHLEDQIAKYDRSSTYLQPNQLFLGEKGHFREVSHLAGPGFKESLSSRGAAFGDIDNDGDIDILVCNSRDRPSLLINEGGNQKSWIQLRLVGKKNRFAIGARVTIESAGVRQVQEVRSGGSYVSQNDLRLHFGLGEALTVDRVTIRWPGGATTTHANLAGRKLHTIEEE